MKRSKKRAGFTLIEMVITLFIVGLLMLLVIPNMTKQQETARKRVDAAIETVVQSQQNIYMMDHNTQELPSLDQLLEENYLTPEQVAEYQAVHHE